MTGSSPTRPSLVVLAAGMARRYGGCKPLAPIGPHGEAVLDLLVERRRPGRIRPDRARPPPRDGPGHPLPRRAVLAGVGRRRPSPSSGSRSARCTPCWPPRRPSSRAPSFAVCNADDVYGEVADGHAGRPARGRRPPSTSSSATQLRSTVATDDPVTRGICTVGPDGLLVSLDERRQVHTDGRRGGFVSDDGLEPRELAGDVPASVNLWGFQSDIWKVFHAAMDASGLDEDALLAQVAAGGEVPKAEVLLPEVISTMVADGTGLPVRVLTDRRQAGRGDPRRRPARSSAPNWPARWPGASARPACGAEWPDPEAGGGYGVSSFRVTARARKRP